MKKIMLLFPYEAEPATTMQDLILLRDNHPDLDEIYLNVHMREDYAKAKIFFEKEIIDFAKFADNNFYSEFQKKFNERAWEIFLFYLLKLSNFEPIEQNKKYSNPDFKIEINKAHLFVEAVTPRDGEEEYNKVLKIPHGASVFGFDQLNHPKIRRVLNSLDNKIKNYWDNHQKVVAENDYYIIAISGANVEGNMNPEDLILEIIGGVNPARHYPRNSDGSHGSEFHNLRSNIPNALGTDTIDIGIFQEQKFNEISGLLYYGKDVVNAILQDPKNEEIIFVHNPNVKPNKKIPLNVFSCFKQMIAVPNGWQQLMPMDEKPKSNRGAST